MPINVQYGPDALLLGQVANQAGLGAYLQRERERAQDAAFRQQQLGLQSQEMTQRGDLAREGMEVNRAESGRRAALAENEQAMRWIMGQQGMASDWMKSQQAMGLQYAQLGERARERDIGYGMDLFKTGVGVAEHERQRMFQESQQENLFRQQQEQEYLREAMQEKRETAQFTRQQKAKLAEFDRVEDFINQQETMGVWQPDQVMEARYKLAQQRAGIHAPQPLPQPTPEQEAMKRMGVFPAQMPDGKPHPMAGKPFIIDRYGDVKPFEYKQDRDPHEERAWSTAERQAMRMATNPETGEVDPAKVAQLTNDLYQAYKSRNDMGAQNQQAVQQQVDETWAQQGQGAANQADVQRPIAKVESQQAQQQPSYDQELKSRTLSMGDFATATPKLGRSQATIQYDGELVYRGYSRPEFETALAEFPKAKHDAVRAQVGWLTEIRARWPKPAQWSPELSKKIAKVVAYLESQSG